MRNIREVAQGTIVGGIGGVVIALAALLGLDASGLCPAEVPALTTAKETSQ